MGVHREVDQEKYHKSRQLLRKAVPKKEGWKPKDNGKALSILLASDNRRNGENAYSIIFQNDMHK